MYHFKELKNKQRQNKGVQAREKNKYQKGAEGRKERMK